MAKALDRLEQTLERVMKDAITQRLGGRLHPVEIARKLSQAMESNQTITAQRILAPNLYTVRLNPSDAEALAPLRATLERELASYLAQAMEESNLSAVTYPRVSLVQDAETARRKIRVEARTVESEQEPSIDQQGGQTVRLRIPSVEAVAGKAWLLSPGPTGKQTSHPISHLPFSLGRALDNDLVLEGRGISRHHAQIRAVHRRLCLMDLSSANSTYLNGKRITESILNSGDTISVGPVQLIFRR
ncbi:MAG: DUF3662 and FHA domain-containing protein [Dehalococcoidia bacterium]|nr:DUF3662 and FHA domain-containing protein [Dehalococcoidia bacterium]